MIKSFPPIFQLVDGDARPTKQTQVWFRDLVKSHNDQSEQIAELLQQVTELTERIAALEP